MVCIRPMTEEDIAFGMRLKAQSGWNQTYADWRRALDLGDGGCFIAELDGVAVGTVATCCFGPVAWIAMMLVDATVRRRGVGKALMSHALGHLQGTSVRTVRLDATPLGRPLYESLGFNAEYGLARYEGVPVTQSVSTEVDMLAPERLDELVALDIAATGTDREKLLRRLFADQPDGMRAVEQNGRLVGYLTTRSGTNALQVGPCVACDDVGQCLLDDAWQRHADSRVFVDVPDDNSAAIAAVTGAGLTMQRPFLRMCRGSRLKDRTREIWACAGPEKG